MWCDDRGGFIRKVKEYGSNIEWDLKSFIQNKLVYYECERIKRSRSF